MILVHQASCSGPTQCLGHRTHLTCHRSTNSRTQHHAATSQHRIGLALSLLRKAQATGAQLLWRCANNRQLPAIELLADGSYLSEIHPPRPVATSAQASTDAPPALTPITVRVIEYAMPGLPEGEPRYRLMTSLLDPVAAPALELAALYHERWQVEAVFDELKTHLLQGRRVLRSKKAPLVRQEFYGWVLAHDCVRWLLHQGAAKERTPHARQSFKAHVQLLRQSLPQSGVFPPTAADSSQALV